LLNIRGFLKAGPRKNFSFKSVRSAKKFADPCFTHFCAYCFAVVRLLVVLVI